MQHKHELYAAKMREAKKTGKPIQADRPRQIYLADILRRIDSMEELSRREREESGRVLRAMEERIRVVEAEYDRLLIDVNLARHKKRKPMGFVRPAAVGFTDSKSAEGSSGR